MFCLPTNSSPAIISAFDSALAALTAAVVAAQGEVNVSSGDVQGRVVNPSGGSSLALLALVGWRSGSAYIVFTQSAAFVSAIADLARFHSSVGLWIVTSIQRRFRCVQLQLQCWRMPKSMHVSWGSE